MRILIWHVHGSWTTAFVQGDHEFVLPLVPDRGPWGRGRAQTWDWPARAQEVPVGRLREMDFDAVVLQRPEELDLVERWTGRRPGQDLPAVYLEHNTPGGPVPFTRHPMADRDDIPVVHVTHFNALMWDTGRAPTYVVEHGIPDPTRLYRPDSEHAAVVVNDPIRRGRAVGADLLPLLAEVIPLEVFGISVRGLAEGGVMPPGRVHVHEDLPQADMHLRLARCRVYLHLHRWTSLGLTLLEAMALGMPVVGLATTEAADVLPADVAILSNDVDRLRSAVRWLSENPAQADAMGRRARKFVLERFGLRRFLDDWDDVLQQVIERQGSRATTVV